MDENLKDQEQEKEQPKEEVKKPEEVKFTDEQNKKIDEIVNKRLSDALSKQQKEFEAKKQQELERAKMTEQEKFEADRQAFVEKEARFNALEKLTEKGLSKDFVDMVKSADMEALEKNINSLQQYIGAEVEKGIKERLNNAPKSPLPQNQNPLPNNQSEQDKRLRRVMGLE